MDNGSFDIVIIGGGASGLMLAANLDLCGARGVILEGTGRIGTKLLMSGGGRCNITHDGSIKDFVHAYGDKGSLLRRCLYKHNNAELRKWLSAHGVETFSEGDRIFPASEKSKDVLDAFVRSAEGNGWKIRTYAKVSQLMPRIADDEQVWNIRLEDGGILVSSAVVIAAGGITYPGTGSDGSMFEILKGLGAEVTGLRPALAPVYVDDYPYTGLAGISLNDVTVEVTGSGADSKRKGRSAQATGDILFMHDGFSGPAVMNVSGCAEPGCRISLSYNKDLGGLPKRMQRVLSDRARGASGDVKTTVLSSLLDHDDFTIKAVSERGMVTRGGVAIDEIDMKTMRMKRQKQLYIIGEALDADGITGGYNLQLCWSTACAAADDLSEMKH